MSAAGVLDRLVALARRRPGLVLAWLLGFHLVVWTFLPIALSRNLQLDLIEALALGREWQLGYWKHPPLPWWMADLGYRITGQLDTVYVLGPLAAVITLYAVWLLARMLVGPCKALVAVAALEGIHYYNISVIKFAHDQMQLPFWAFTGLFFRQALARGRALDWMLAGVCLAGAFWSKYAAFVLGVTMALILLLDPFARRTWRTPGPYLMAAAFAIVIAPNVWWLITHDFMPLQYVDNRAEAATRWYQYLAFPLRWVGGQAFFLAPALAVLALLYLPRSAGALPTPTVTDAFDRRYILAMTLGPFIVTTVMMTALGREPVSFWAYPFWSFAPLALLMVVPPALDAVRLRRFAGAAVAVVIGFPMAYAAVELGEPLWSDRMKATHYPGRMLAEVITRQWHEKTGQPLAYVGGAIVLDRRGGFTRELPGPGEFASNNVAIYSPDRPRVLVKGELRFSPWMDAADLDRRGIALVWQGLDGELPDNIKRNFPRAELQPPLTLPRQTFLPWHRGKPIIIHVAFVLPRP
jgi:hypothetical protein